MRGSRRGSRSRRCALPLGIALALAACSGVSARHVSTPRRVAVETGTVRVESAGFPAQLTAALHDEILATIADYVEQATVEPIETGKPAPATLTGLFTADAAARLTSLDRSTLVDDGAGPATSPVAVKIAPANLTALADPSGTIVLVAATLSVEARADTPAGTLRVDRTGDLVLASSGGTWKIFGFDVSVRRSGPGVGGTTGAGS